VLQHSSPRLIEALALFASDFEHVRSEVQIIDALVGSPSIHRGCSLRLGTTEFAGGCLRKRLIWPLDVPRVLGTPGAP
jgi:hypothetical protein